MECNSTQTLCNLPSNKNQQYQMRAKQATSSPSATGSIATQLYFNRSLACFLSANCCCTNARCSRVGITPFSRRQSSKLSRSLQRKSVTQQVCCRKSCCRKSFRTELYWTYTLMSAWRPEKANSDSMSFFFVRALVAEQSSIIKSVGSPLNTRYKARR